MSAFCSAIGPSAALVIAIREQGAGKQPHGTFANGGLRYLRDTERVCAENRIWSLLDRPPITYSVQRFSPVAARRAALLLPL